MQQYHASKDSVNTEEFLEDNEYFTLNKMTIGQRSDFIKKVYGIISVQMFITTVFILFSIFSPSYQNFYLNNFWLVIVSLIIILCIIYAFAYTSLSRQVPTNYFLLGLFTLAEGYSVSFVGIAYPQRLILLAAVLTVMITIGLTIYAAKTDSDITAQGSLLYMLFFVLIGIGFVQIFVQNTILEIIGCTIGVMLYGLYLVYDTQLMLGSKSNQFLMDDYIWAAMSIYLDILNLFLEILRLLNALSKNQLIWKQNFIFKFNYTHLLIINK